MKNILTIISLCLLSQLVDCSTKINNQPQHNSAVSVADTLVFSENITEDTGIQVLTKGEFSMKGDSVKLSISDNEVKAYFETADTIPQKIALKQLASYRKEFSIQGEMVEDGDTLNYYILADGTAITYKYSRLISKERDVKFYRNTINLPSDNYNKIKSKLNILCFSKSKFDFALWELWKQDDTEGIYTDNNDQYKAYKRWNEQLDANGICKAFSMMKSVPEKSYFNVDWTVDHDCSLFGLAIMDGQLYTLYMNGGGVIFLSLADNDYEELCYGCYKPECLKYFTYYLNRSDD